MPDSERSEILSSGGVITTMALGIYLSSLYSYLLFHSLIEITTIAIGFTLFIMIWNSRRFLTNDCLKVLGIGYAFIALIDLLHTLAYKGMNVFPAFGANLPTQLWIVARALQAATLCLAPIFVRRRINEMGLIGGYGIAITALAALVFSGNFPVCYVDGKGLTTFKIVSEYVITGFLLTSLLLLQRVRADFSTGIYSLIAFSIVCTVVSEVCFTAYLSVYGIANMFGHMLKLVAYYLIYRALLVSGFKEPFNLIFKDLKQAEIALQRAHDSLEEQFRERTGELRASEERYRSLIHKVQAAILLHDGQGCILDSNPLAQELLGLSADQLLGKDLSDPEWHFLRVDGSVLPVAEYPASLILSTRLPLRGYVTGISSPNRVDVAWVLVNAELEFDDKGEISLIIVSFVDITDRKLAEEVLRTSLGSYRMAQAMSHVGNWEYDIQTNEFWGSDEAKRIYGFDPDRDRFSADAVEQCIPERERVHQALVDLIEKCIPYNLEFAILPRNSPEPKIIVSIAELLWDEQGNPCKVVGVIQDITERKRSEETLNRLNRELRAISNCNQVLMKATDEQMLLAEICRIICDDAEYRMAWVGYAENDDAKTIRPVVWAGVEEGYLADAHITWDDTERGRGPTGIAIRTGQTDHIQDFASETKAAPWREAALRRGYRSSISLPLKDEDERVFGVLNIYSVTTNAFTLDEIRLMEELAGDLSFGITALRARAARKAAEQSITLLSFALDNVREGAFLVDEKARFHYVNEESCRVLGYSRNELLAMGVGDVDPDFPAERWSGHWDELKRCGSLTFEGHHRARGGRVFPVEINANYLEFEGQGYDLALVRDITERKRAEASLKNAALRLNEAQRIAHIGSWELDITTNTLTWTDEIYRIFEIDPAKFGATYEAFLNAIHPEDREAVNAAYSSSLKTRTPYTIDHRLRFPDGRIKYVHEQCETFFEDDTPIRSMGTVQEITDRKLAEEELSRLNRELEQRVTQRTAEYESKNVELEKMNKIFIGRELRMVELKEKIRELEKKISA